MQQDFSEWDARPLDPLEEVLEFELEEVLSDLPGRTLREERMNMWSHGLFAGLSVLAALYLLWLAVFCNAIFQPFNVLNMNWVI